MSIHRFYFADGHVEFHHVHDAPRVWKLMDKPDLDLRIGTIEQELKIMPMVNIRLFARHDYGYPPDFIGPHRDVDYHEE